MTLSINSLKGLPDKQVLLLALAEKAKREKAKTELLARQRDPGSSIRRDVPSLVMTPGHPFYDLIHKRRRYKVYWGGRGSGKSWAIAEALIRIAVRHCVRVLCVREFQNTIKDSSHKILKDTIARLGLQAFFVVTAEGIRSRTGSEFIFKGLHGNDESIKSTEGIDICWVEEAQSVSDASWRTLTPTIRTTPFGYDAEIWVSYNLLDEDAPTHQRFVMSKASKDESRYCVHKVNFDANPFFEKSPLYADMLDDRENNFHMYEHIWLGMPLIIDDSIILSGKYCEEEFPDDLWKQADGGLHFGADFGYAQDASTLIRSFILPSPVKVDKLRLYIDHEAYQTGVELDEYDEFYQGVPMSKQCSIRADCALPATISHIRRNWGYTIEGAEKWQGSVDDGIKFLRGFEKIVIHSRCKNTLREARQWRYKVDKLTKKVVTPAIPIDRDNHAWDAVRYSYDKYIERSGELGVWHRLGQEA